MTFRINGRPFRAVRACVVRRRGGRDLRHRRRIRIGQIHGARRIAGLVPFQADRSKSTAQPAAGAQPRGPANAAVRLPGPLRFAAPAQTVDDMLREPLDHPSLADLDERIAKAIAEVGLLPIHRFRYPHQLSGGQRQRVAIARA